MLYCSFAAYLAQRVMTTEWIMAGGVMAGREEEVAAVVSVSPEISWANIYEQAKF